MGTSREGCGPKEKDELEWVGRRASWASSMVGLGRSKKGRDEGSSTWCPSRTGVIHLRRGELKVVATGEVEVRPPDLGMREHLAEGYRTFIGVRELDRRAKNGASDYGNDAGETLSRDHGRARSGRGS
jgi:hypothetical protein